MQNARFLKSTIYVVVTVVCTLEMRNGHVLQLDLQLILDLKGDGPQGHHVSVWSSSQFMQPTLAVVPGLGRVLCMWNDTV